MDVPLEHVHVMGVVRQHEHTARRIHHVVIKLVRQRLPQFQRVLVKRLAFLPQIVRPDDCGVAAGIAAAKPALFQDRHVADGVLLGKVIGGRKAVAARANDHDIVASFGLRRAPLARPVRVTRRGVA